MKPKFNIQADYKPSATVPSQKTVHAIVSFSFLEAMSYEEFKNLVQCDPLAVFVKFDAHEQYSKGERPDRDGSGSAQGFMFGEVQVEGQEALEMLEYTICKAFSVRRENLYTEKENQGPPTYFTLHYSREYKQWAVDKRNAISFIPRVLELGPVSEKEALETAKSEFVRGGLKADGPCFLYLRRETLLLQR